MSKILGRNDIIKQRERRRETVDCPELGGSVIIQELMADESEEWLAKVTSQARNGGITKLHRADLLVLSIVNNKGERELTKEDIAALGQQPNSAINRLFDCASRLSGITDEKIEAKVKN